MNTYQWLIVDFIIVCVYGLQHTLLTTKIAVKIYNNVLPSYTWNLSYSVFSVITLVLGFKYWETSGVYIFYLEPGSALFHLFVIGLALSLFFFFFCFKYTTSFFQWIGIKQIITKITKTKAPTYYRVRQEGIKRYIRFPHHTCLIFLFWLHPVMTLDTLFLAIAATAYLYLGTWHQDKRGEYIIGEQWTEYQKVTNLLLPGVNSFRRMKEDFQAWKKANVKEIDEGGVISEKEKNDPVNNIA